MKFRDQLKDDLIVLGACGEAIEWVGEKNLWEAWETCKVPEWMAWLVGRVCDEKIADNVLDSIVNTGKKVHL